MNYLLTRPVNVTLLTIYFFINHNNSFSAGSLYIIPILLDRGVGINVRDSLHQTALHKAVQRGGASEVVCLLEHAADVQAADSLGHTPLHLAAKR